MTKFLRDVTLVVTFHFSFSRYFFMDFYKILANCLYSGRKKKVNEKNYPHKANDWDEELAFFIFFEVFK